MVLRKINHDTLFKYILFFIVFLVEMAVYSSIVSTLKSASFVCFFFLLKLN